MDKEIWIIIGIVLGGVISVITTLIVQSYQNKREYYKLAFELAKEEYQTVIRHSKEHKLNATILPLEVYVTYYLKYVKIVNSKRFKLSDLDKVRSFQKEINDYYQKN